MEGTLDEAHRIVAGGGHYSPKMWWQVAKEKAEKKKEVRNPPAPQQDKPGYKIMSPREADETERRWMKDTLAAGKSTVTGAAVLSGGRVKMWDASGNRVRSPEEASKAKEKRVKAQFEIPPGRRAARNTIRTTDAMQRAKKSK
jgi:hypothetical protein